MYIDFHTHGKLAKKLPFSKEYTDWLLREAKEAGLDAICLTEHFNTLQFDEVYGYLMEKCKREGDTLVTTEGLRVFTGMETDIAEGGHILSLGTLEQLKRLHFLDLNGKDIALNQDYFEEKTGMLAKKLDVPMISGSDTHQAVQYGCVRTKFSHSIETVQELYEEMKKGNYEIVISPNASFQVKTAGILKKALKEIHNLGGDYVSVLVNQNNE